MQHAADKGLIFFSTPFDHDSADFLDSLSIPVFKVSSGDLTNYPLLQHIAKFGRPMVLSTGMASQDQVEAAVSALEAANMPALALLHCVTSYPANPADCNLHAMETLRSRFKIPIGWSDHTVGFDISIAAVALGANILEKHFTLDRRMPGPDHAASLEPSELIEMMKAIRRVESALGDGVKHPVDCEIAVAPIACRSLYWKRNLRNGEAVTAKDLIALRPGTGISPTKLTLYVGCQVVKDVQAGEMLQESDLMSSAV
jgi:sialic acid synthase SpsE